MKPELFDQAPPHDDDAERCVIGSILVDPSRLDELGALRPEHFRSPANRILYRHLRAMQDERVPIGAQTLGRRLQRAGDAEGIGGAEYLAAVVHSVAVPSHAAYHARIVLRAAKLRQLRQAGLELFQRAQAADTDPDQVVVAAEAALADITTGDYQGEPVTALQAAGEMIALVDAIMDRRRQAGLMTGLVDFDETFGGLFPGELVVLAARPGVGKTALACQVAYHVAAAGRLVYFASLEMSAVELTSRICCSLARVNSKRIRTGTLTASDTAALADASHQFAQAKLYLHDRPGLTVLDIRRPARRLKRHGLTLVVVDYLQRITPSDPKIPRYQQVGQMTDGLKQLARELDVPILCVCQLNRESEKDDRPRLSHLRESGSIEQDADVVLLLHRTTSGADGATGDDMQAKLMIEKNRNGETGVLKLTWVPSEVRYECGWSASAPRAATANRTANHESAFDQWS